MSDIRAHTLSHRITCLSTLIHYLKKCLLSSYSVPGPVDTVENEIEKVSALSQLTFQWRDKNNEVIVIRFKYLIQCAWNIDGMVF